MYGLDRKPETGELANQKLVSWLGSLVARFDSALLGQICNEPNNYFCSFC
jgi:hypothetical protein